MYKPRSNKLDLMTKRSLWGWVFVAPFIIGFLFFVISPLYTSFMFSINEQVMNKDIKQIEIVYRGFQFYKDAFRTDVGFLDNIELVINTSLFQIIAVLIFSFIIANMLNHQFKGRTVARAIFFMPVVTASGVASMLSTYNWEYSRTTAEVNSATSGSLNLQQTIMNTLQSVEGLEKFADLISQAINQLSQIVMLSGVPILIFLAALQTISPSLFEASDIEGASKWEAFWKITFPMVSPMILVNLMYTMIDVLCGQHNPVMSFLFNQSVMGTGSTIPVSLRFAMGWIYFIAASVFIFGISGIVSKLVYYENDKI